MGAYFVNGCLKELFRRSRVGQIANLPERICISCSNFECWGNKTRTPVSYFKATPLTDQVSSGCAEHTPSAGVDCGYSSAQGSNFCLAFKLQRLPLLYQSFIETFLCRSQCISIKILPRYYFLPRILILTYCIRRSLLKFHIYIQILS